MQTASEVTFICNVSGIVLTLMPSSRPSFYNGRLLRMVKMMISERGGGSTQLINVRDRIIQFHVIYSKRHQTVAFKLINIKTIREILLYANETHLCSLK